MKHNYFEQGKQELYNKDKYLKNYIDCMFTKTNELFKYENVPEEINIKKFEYFLQKNGFIFFIKENGKYHFYNGSLFDYDVYDEPLKINATLENRSVKTYDLTKEGVLVCNDFLRIGLEKIFKKYGVMLNECEITLYLSAIMNRVQFLINANDDNTKKSADMFLQKIYEGDFSIIGSNAFFEGVEVNGINQNVNSTQNNIELTQYIKASAFNEIGLNSNFNMKRERLNTKELSLNENAIKPFIEEMFNCRKSAIDKINEMYGLNIIVTMSTIWDNYTPEPEPEETPEETETPEEPEETTPEEPETPEETKEGVSPNDTPEEPEPLTKEEIIEEVTKRG